MRVISSTVLFAVLGFFLGDGLGHVLCQLTCDTHKESCGLEYYSGIAIAIFGGVIGLLVCLKKPKDTHEKATGRLWVCFNGKYVRKDQIK